MVVGLIHDIPTVAELPTQSSIGCFKIEREEAPAFRYRISMTRWPVIYPKATRSTVMADAGDMPGHCRTFGVIQRATISLSNRGAGAHVHHRCALLHGTANDNVLDLALRYLCAPDGFTDQSKRRFERPVPAMLVRSLPSRNLA